MLRHEAPPGHRFFAGITGRVLAATSYGVCWNRRGILLHPVFVFAGNHRLFNFCYYRLVFLLEPASNFATTIFWGLLNCAIFCWNQYLFLREPVYFFASNSSAGERRRRRITVATRGRATPASTFSCYHRRQRRFFVGSRDILRWNLHAFLLVLANQWSSLFFGWDFLAGEHGGLSRRRRRVVFGAGTGGEVQRLIPLRSAVLPPARSGVAEADWPVDLVNKREIQEKGEGRKVCWVSGRNLTAAQLASYG